MSSSSDDVLIARKDQPNNQTGKLQNQGAKMLREINEISINDEKEKSSHAFQEIENDEKPPVNQNKQKERIVYTRDELLEIKVLAASIKRPSILSEEFFNGKVWEPDAWFQSDSSRSSSPFVVDGKTAVTEGKKTELFNIELAPKYNRDSFKEGCKVKPAAQSSDRQTNDKIRRLTGRAATQRKHFETNYKDGESISASTYEFEKLRRQDRDVYNNHSKDNYDVFNEKQNHNKYGKRNEKSSQEEDTPEWMSEPVPKGDTFNFFNSRIEEEKKEFAARSKKKKVRISPDVDKQKQKEEKPPSKNIPSRDEKAEDKKFDINEFMKGVEYFPPQMFSGDKDDVRSKFTKFFQNEERIRSNSRNSRPPSGTLIPDEVISGSPVSPNVSQAFFAPIQPAPALVSAAANAHAIQTSNISNIIEKKRQERLLENLQQTKREIRGSLSLEELEGVKSQPLESTQTSVKQVPNDNGQDAFNFLLQSMKSAGQLPEKPCPVVSGLPGHLLPQPPTRTSPVFEKLKRTLSRSPSPKDFAKAVSTMASIISSHPTIDKELAILKQSRIEQNDATTVTVKWNVQDDAKCLYARNSSSSPAMSTKKTPLNAFTPTSVLKKMHHERKDDNDKQDTSIISHQKDSHDTTVANKNEKMNLNSQFLDAAISPNHSFPDSRSKFMPFHSAPVSPKNYIQSIATNIVSVSAPGTPNRRNELDPPSIKRLQDQHPGLDSSVFDKLNTSKDKENTLMTPSAFKTVQTSSKSGVGVIGSGMRQPTNRDGVIIDQFAKMNVSLDNHQLQRRDEENLATGSGPRPQQLFNVKNFPNQHSSIQPQKTSQQQQLLQAQRMAQIQQAQLLQQQKLQEIAKLGKQGNQPPPVRPLLPEADKPANQNLLSPHEPLYQQQQQHQQLLAFQQQLLHQQRHPFPPNGFPNNHRVSGQPPMPPRFPGFQQFPNQPQMNSVNLAAQALMQQQLYNQAARARLIAQATLFQQQPQVMQAALMAQAALVRGQAQAQAAMMLNPRNLQVMAEQMGLRQPFNPSKQNRRQGSNTSTPTATSPDDTGVKSSEENILSKWFSNDVLQQSNKASHNGPIKNGQILSVEDLENRKK